MSAATITPLEALRRLIAEVKQLDEVEVGARWNQLQGELGVAEGVVRDARPVIWVSPNEKPHEDHGVLYGTNRQIVLIGSTEGPFGDYTVPLYGDCTPVAAQPSRTVLGDELLASLEALQTGCTEPSWIGWQNGEGEEVGTRLQAAIDAYKAAPTAAVSAAPSGEVERATIMEEAAKLCDFQATWAKGEADDEQNSVRYRHENRERQTAAELCAASIRAAITATKEPK